MKITQVEIDGMHRAHGKSYALNPGVTYFIGENGAGKSTILEAIQLAFLGYIPNHLKTKEGIMKHASGKFMEVKVTLDSGIVIDRTWMRSASGTITSECNVQGFEGDPADLLKGVNLPILDFNEFNALTANKQKEWFIDFLPSDSANADIMKLLKGEIKNRNIQVDELISRVDARIKASPSKGLDLVKELNTYLKSEQSFVKGEVAKLSGTIESLVRYDDIDIVDSSSLKTRINELNQAKTAILKFSAEHEAWARMNANVERLENMLGGVPEDQNPKILEAEAKIKEITDEIEADRKEAKALADEINQIYLELNALPNVSTTCPYTNEECEKVAKIFDESQAKRAELQAKLDSKLDEQRSSGASSKVAALEAEIAKYRTTVSELTASYAQLKAAKAQVQNEPIFGYDYTWESVEAELAKVQNDLIKVEANAQYDALTEKVTKDKFKLENELEALKVWVKYTDANGLQTSLMNEPFKALSADMSKYLTQIFGQPTTAEFNLVAKANSFSFGINRDGQYIEFDCLSSGERCLFTLALMMCILDRSESQVKVILVDDLLDHLDDANADSLFKSLSTVPDMQFILAGVKACSQDEMCYQV